MEARLEKTHLVSEGERLSSSIAMTMALVSFAMLFATLFLGYVAFRFTAVVWPPMGMQKVDLALPTLSTLIILLSSFTYLLFDSTQNRKWLSATTILGLIFMITQFVFWHDLKAAGIYVDTSIFASMIYAFTWIHAGHVVAGVLALLWLLFNFEKKDTSLWVKNVGQFWHFLGIVWFIMFLGIFVL